MMRARLPHEWDGETPITRADTGLTIKVKGNYLHHFRPKNHLGMGDDVRYLITDGPKRIGDRWFARSVRALADDDGNMWLCGFGSVPDASFGDPDVPLCWRQREDESWDVYS